MMRVTELKPLGKGRYEVYLNGEIAFVLYKGDLARYDLHEGDELSPDTLEEIYTETLYKRALNRVLFLLQSRDYTYHELESKLYQGKYPEQIITAALEEVQSYGYINDENYARRYVECYLERKSLGKIKQELIKRGISRDIVDAALEGGRELQAEAEENVEQLQIRRLLEKRHFDAQTADRKEMDRNYAFLMRRGYSSSDIRAVFRELRLGFDAPSDTGFDLT